MVEGYGARQGAGILYGQKTIAQAEATVVPLLQSVQTLRFELDGAKHYVRPAVGQQPAPRKSPRSRGTAWPAGSPATVRRAVSDYLRRIDLVQQLLVLRTDPGLAQPLALAIDQAELAEVVGTVAGDDTVLVITRHARAGREVTRLFEGWARG